MIPPSQYLRSVEWIVLAWAVSLLLLLACWLFCRGRHRPLSGLVQGEEGAANSVSHVLVFPVYLVVVCLLAETTQLLLAKMGTVYAAYATARSAVVWRSAVAEDPAAAREQPRRAAIYALAPFASSHRGHAAGASAAPGADGYVQAAASRLKNSTTQEHVRGKLRYANQAVRVEVSKQAARPGDPVRVTLTYEAPIYSSIIGRWFGRRPSTGGSYFVYLITSEIELPDESPRSDNRSLGVRYVSTP